MSDEYLYFFVYYWCEQKEKSKNIKFLVLEDKYEQPESVYFKGEFDGKKFNCIRIFKTRKKTPTGNNGEQKPQDYYFEFSIGENKYVISFEAERKNIFIFDVTLKVGKRIIDIQRKIDQSKIEYDDKIEYFLEALKKDDEDDLIDDFYQEAIDLYSQKKSFFFLISLFIKIYQKKDICSKLLIKFKEINEDKKNNDNNMDRKAKLKNYTSNFENILKNEAEQLINNNKYDTIEFYGLILCYLNYYDKENFSEAITKLYNQNQKDLFEILLIYHTHFFYPIKQESNLLNEFIVYTIKQKKFDFFQIGLNYIKDVEILIKILEENKEKIYEKYFKSKEQKEVEKYVIKIDKNIKFKNQNNKKEINNESLGEQNNNSEDKTQQEFSSDNFISFENCNAAEPIKEIKDDSISDDEVRIKRSENIIKIIKNIGSIIEFSKKKISFLLIFQ